MSETNRPNMVNLARDLQNKISAARQAKDYDALIAIENELGMVADETDKMMASMMGQLGQAAPAPGADTPSVENPDPNPAVTDGPLDDVVTGELLPQVDESDAVQHLPPDTERRIDEAL